MISYRTDRERQVQGRRIRTRNEMFDQLAVPVADFHERFSKVHADLEALLDRPGVSSSANGQGADATTQATQLYTWAYHRLATPVAPFVSQFSSARALALSALEPEIEPGVDAEHTALRQQWDDQYLALRDITAGFLRADGRMPEIDAFFGSDADVESVDRAEPEGNALADA